MSDRIYDVVQVGYGPVSKSMAIMLSRHGHQVAIFERFSEVYPLPRAVCIDHEIYRVLHANGLGGQLDEFTSPAPKYRWFNANWRELLCIDWTAESISGGSEVNFVHQPSVERSLDLVVRETTNVSLQLGWEAIDVKQTPDYVELTVRNMESNATKLVKSRYLVGIDGANSFIRCAIGSGRKDLGFEADWLVIDLVLKDGVTVESLGIPECGQYCNPIRPTTIVPGGLQGGRICRRWEFMRLPHETKAEMETTEKVWELLGKWIKPDQADLIRHTVYTFRSLVADKWRDGRILIAGDAAHVMPPFMGQGMCAGMRDAWNLTWKLDMLLKGSIDDGLLDTFQQEREPHVSDVIRASIFLGQIICIPDPAEAAKRDELFLSGSAPPPAPFPILTDGLLDRGGDGKPRGLAGQLSPHAVVRAPAGEGRFDQVVGLGFLVVLAPGVDVATISASNREFLISLGAKVVALADKAAKRAAVVDLHGKFTDFLLGAKTQAMIVRPDFYIFGDAGGAEGVDALVGNLKAQLDRFGFKDSAPKFNAAPKPPGLKIRSTNLIYRGAMGFAIAAEALSAFS
jgi:2-polyprenyl-6-methoxyphenol hydroxylase-like FAD-dependent oxidoreductase